MQNLEANIKIVTTTKKKKTQENRKINQTKNQTQTKIFLQVFQ